jgi:hypothetical protein
MEDTYYGGEQSEAMLRPWMEKKRVGGKKEKKRNDGVDFWVSLCFLISNSTINLDVKQYCPTIWWLRSFIKGK